MTIMLELSSETERRLRERAAQSGQTLEGYLHQLVERDAQAADGVGTGSPDPAPSPDEFDRRLDELSEGLAALPALPGDWSRADLHADHD